MKKLKTERAVQRIKNKFVLTLFGAVMALVALPIFIADRFLMAFLPWIPLPTIKQFYSSEKLVVISLFRVVLVAILYGLYYLIRSIF
jgi:hypothetical protein